MKIANMFNRNSVKYFLAAVMMAGMISISQAQTSFHFGFSSDGQLYGNYRHTQPYNYGHDRYNRYPYRYEHRYPNPRRLGHPYPHAYDYDRAYRHGYKLYECDWLWDEMSQRYKRICR